MAARSDFSMELDLAATDTDELAKHVAENFLMLKMASIENIVSTLIYKLRCLPATMLSWEAFFYISLYWCFQ